MSEVKTNKITSLASNNDITIDPDGTGDVIVASGHKLGVGKSSPVSPVDIEAADGVADNAFALRVQNLESTDDRSYGVYVQAGSTSVDDALHVYEHTGSTSLFRVAGNGNVGIGTSGPTELLHLNANNPEFAMQAASDGGECAIYFKDDDGNKDGRITYRTDYAGQTDNYMQFFTNNSEKMRIDSSGNVLVGTTSTTPNPGILFQPAGNVTCGNSTGSSGFEFVTFRRSGTQIGSITQNGTTGISYNTSSDYRLKEAVVDMTGAITRVKSLQPKRFNFIADDTVTVDGFMAHEAQAVVPEAVTGTHDEVDADGNPVMQGIDQSKLVPLLTAALKESIAKIEALETENTTQATQIADLITRVTALENA